MNRRELHGKYRQQERSAKHRDIEWMFTFDTWLDWWIATGKLEERGRRGHEYVMCRKDDIGPYSPDNVYCDTNGRNVGLANRLTPTNTGKVWINDGVKSKCHFAGVPIPNGWSLGMTKR